MLRTTQFTVVWLVLAVFLMCGALPAQAACTSPQVIIFHAGSLNAAFKAIEAKFTADTGICVTDQAFGSLDMLRQATAGGQAADIVAPADYLDIDLFLKPDRYVDYNILFAEGKMVLAYCLGSSGVTNDPCGGVSKQSSSIAAAGTFAPTSPTSDAIPKAVQTWYQVLSTPGVVVGGSHLYLDPSGYRAPMIFRLAQSNYNVPNLYNNLLEHYLATPATSPLSVPLKLGVNYDYQFIYQNNAYANYLIDPANYRYVNLPDQVNLGNSALNCYYRQAVIVEPDLFGTGFVPLPASRVIWGVSILKTATNKDSAIKFLQYLLGTVGQAVLTTNGPAPIIPAVVSDEDFRKLPKVLKPLVQVDHLLGCPEEWRCR